MSLSKHRLANLVVVTSLLLSACSDSSIKSEEGALLFSPCKDMQELECGAFEVPLIHDSTDSRQISIEVARLPGIGDGPHEPLIINFGGPGSGIEILQEMIEFEELPTLLRERYDVIGFDQRGVGHPLRIDCDHLSDMASSTYPRTRSEVQTMVDNAEQLADACFREYSDSLLYVGSKAVVKDLEVMRTQLGAPKLNIIGVSFGTRISALYLEHFPGTSGRVVLDAPLRPNGKIESLSLDTVTARQHSFEKMLDACGLTLPACDRTSIESTFIERLNSLLDTDDRETLKAFFLLLTIGIEESDNGEFLAPVLIDYVNSGDPTNMFELIQEFGLDDQDEEDDNNESNASITLEKAVLCADDAVRPSTDSLISTLSQLNENSDFFAETIMELAATCVGWPMALDPITDIQSAVAPISLVIGGLEDVNTPIDWVIETAESIGGVFLSSDHLGHTTVFMRGNDCVDSRVLDFLLEGTLPEEGAACH